jgi:hypothetical protein
MKDQLPSLQLRKEAECRHSRMRIAAADFPVQLSVGLRLN